MQLSEIIGKVPIKIEVIHNSSYDEDNELLITFDDNKTLTFCHSQDCCESVTINDVNGDWNDLLNTPLLVAEERTSWDDLADTERNNEELWTFYTFRSNKGSVDVRWLGSSNGYYSMDVYYYWKGEN